MRRRPGRQADVGPAGRAREARARMWPGVARRAATTCHCFGHRREYHHRRMHSCRRFPRLLAQPWADAVQVKLVLAGQRRDDLSFGHDAKADTALNLQHRLFEIFGPHGLLDSRRYQRFPAFIHVRIWTGVREQVRLGVHPGSQDMVYMAPAPSVWHWGWVHAQGADDYQAGAHEGHDHNATEKDPEIKATQRIRILRLMLSCIRLQRLRGIERICSTICDRKQNDSEHAAVEAEGVKYAMGRSCVAQPSVAG